MSIFFYKHSLCESHPSWWTKPQHGRRHRAWGRREEGEHEGVLNLKLLNNRNISEPAIPEEHMDRSCCYSTTELA